MLQGPLEHPLESVPASDSASALQRGLEAAILTAEVTPINEAARVAVGGIAIAKGLDPVGVAIAYGSATLAIESAAAVAASNWLTTERSKKTIGWFNGKLEERGIPAHLRLSRPMKAAVAFLGGSAISQAVKFREEPDIEKQEIRGYGLRTAGVLAGTCALQGYGVAAGIETPNPVTIGLSFAAIGSVAGIYKWAKRRVGKNTANFKETAGALTDEN